MNELEFRVERAQSYYQYLHDLDIDEQWADAVSASAKVTLPDQIVMDELSTFESGNQYDIGAFNRV